MKDVSLSPSSINLYKESPLLFYYQYIEQAEPDTKVPTCYGVAGTLVHEMLEEHSVKELDLIPEFEKRWKEAGLQYDAGINGLPLQRSKYLQSVFNGVSVLNVKTQIIPEEKIKFPLMSSKDMNIYASGIVDVIYEEDGEYHIIDWKTSSSLDTDGKFELQAKMYCYLLYETKGIVPKTVTFEYLKINKKKTYSFTEADIMIFAEYLRHLAESILTKGLDINQYEIGDVSSIFNQHAVKCQKEKDRRNGNI